MNWLKTRNSPGAAGVEACQLDAPHGVANVDVAARLAASAVHRERLADRRLDAEPVQDRAEHLVVVEAIHQRLVQRHFVGRRAVDDALIQIRRPQPPHPAREHDVVAVVDLREVVERAGLLRVRQRIGAAVVLDGDVALFDVDVRRAALAHRPELHQVAVRRLLADREQQVERADDVVDLGEDGVLPVDHRVGAARCSAKWTTASGRSRSMTEARNA